MTLNDIASPADIRGLSDEKLATLAFEIRKFLVSSISETGGHLASNLGVVELTLALHSVFDFSKDSDRKKGKIFDSQAIWRNKRVSENFRKHI